MPARPSPARRGSLIAGRSSLAFCLVAAVASVALAGCGRRGALDPPADPSLPPVVAPPAGAPRPTGRPDTSPRREVSARSSSLVNRPDALVENAPQDEEEVQDGVTVNPLPAPRKRVRGYAVPKDPFFLDPLL